MHILASSLRSRRHSLLPGTSARLLLLGAWLVAGSVGLGQSTWLRMTPTTPQFLNGVSHGAGTYVAVGEGGAVLTSADASSWSVTGSGTAADLRKVIHAGGQFVAVGAAAIVLTSPDGSTWTQRPTGLASATTLSGLAFGNGNYVAVGGNGGTIIKSPDGITWTEAASSRQFGTFLQGVSFAEGLFVATGAGTILTSTDGSSWSASSLPLPTPFLLVSSGYVAGRYLAVGLNGEIVSSSDGATWTYESSGTLSNLRSIATNGTSTVICGDNGTILRSADGMPWSNTPSGQSVILSDLVFADGRFVAVGDKVANSGLIIAADEDPGIRWRTSSISTSESAGSVTLTIERLGPTTTATMIDYLTIAGTAVAGVDFTPASGTAEMAIGENTVEVVIAITNNPESEVLESFTVTLSNPSANELLYNPATTKVEIFDANDGERDGLPDDWELLHFPGVDSFGPDDDPDGDGNTNAREFRDNTDPKNPASAAYTLALGVSSGLGTVTASPDLASYPRGTTIMLTPSPSVNFSFLAWEGDASGGATPLVFAITGDLAIDAAFGISLTDALDDPCLDWTVGGTGPAWEGQELITFDGSDAAATGGLAFREQSLIETRVYGPAEITFHWKVSAGLADSYDFRINGSSRASTSGESEWEMQSFFVGAGTHTVQWRYSKNSSSLAGSNQVWLDKVILNDGYDSWKRAFFSTTERIDPSISGTAADPDKDGLPNLLEYLFNQLPKAPHSDWSAAPTMSIEESGRNPDAFLTWSQHRKRAEHLRIAVEFSPSLEEGSWQELATPLELVSTAGAMETMRVTKPISLDTSPRGFFRLNVSLLP